MRSLLSATAVLLTSGAVTVIGAGNEVGEFTTQWNGQRVVVTSALYTVLYDEVGRLGRQYRGKAAGLTVATPTGQYYEFDGPGSDEDITELTADRVFDQMSVRFYRSNPLELSNVKTITPVKLRRFEPGVALMVETVTVDRNRVRLEFHRKEETDPGFATSLTIEWPSTFSKGFGEREAVESVIRRFIGPL